MPTPGGSGVAAVLVAAAVAGAAAHPPFANGAVLCAKARKDGTFGSSLRIRETCTKREVEVHPAALGFCCEPSSTTTAVTTTTSSVTSSVCPTFTTTTLGVPDCGGDGATCFGLCPNALACVPDRLGGCSCTGPELSCQVVSAGGACGGTCPEGLTCRTVQPVGQDGCPEYPRCGCAPVF